MALTWKDEGVNLTPLLCEVQKEDQAHMMFYQEQHLVSNKAQHKILHAIST